MNHNNNQEKKTDNSSINAQKNSGLPEMRPLITAGLSILPLLETMCKEPIPKEESKEQAYITEHALNSMISAIGSLPAESGGLLLGPADRDGISEFVFDEKANTSPVTYEPSYSQLSDLCEVAARNRKEGKGMGHSHPGGMSFPSQGDLIYAKEFFKANPSMVKFYMPILTHTPIVEYCYIKPESSKRQPTKAATGKKDIKKGSRSKGLPIDWPHHVKFFVVYRNDPSTIREADIVISDEPDFPPLERSQASGISDMAKEIDLIALSHLIGDVDINRRIIQADGFNIGCLSVEGNNSSILVLLPSEFPLIQPAVVVSNPGSDSYQYPFYWSIESNETPLKRLARLISAAMSENLVCF